MISNSQHATEHDRPQFGRPQDRYQNRRVYLHVSYLSRHTRLFRVVQYLFRTHPRVALAPHFINHGPPASVPPERRTSNPALGRHHIHPSTNTEPSSQCNPLTLSRGSARASSTCTAAMTTTTDTNGTRRNSNRTKSRLALPGLPSGTFAAFGPACQPILVCGGDAYRMRFWGKTTDYRLSSVFFLRAW